MNTCGKCGTVLRDGSMFCDKCGTAVSAPLKMICPKCKNEVDDGLIFCNTCGEKLGLPSSDQGVAPIYEPKPKPRPEPDNNAATEKCLRSVHCRYSNHSRFIPPLYGELRIYSDKIEFTVDIEKHKNSNKQVVIILRNEMLGIKTVKSNIVFFNGSIINKDAIEIEVSANDKYKSNTTLSYSWRFQSSEEAREICNLINRQRDQ